MKVGVALTDILTGLYASIGILAAIAFRARAGLGRHVDLALLDVQVATLANQASNYLVSGVTPARLGTPSQLVPYQEFRTADGYMIVAVGNDAQFPSMCRVLGHPEWAKDERFRSNPDRVANRDVLVQLIQDVTTLRSTAMWASAMEKAGVPCGPINTIDEVFADAQVRARGMRIAMEHLAAGRVPLVANPIRMSESPVEYRVAPPMLGADSEAILSSWLGRGS